MKLLCLGDIALTDNRGSDWVWTPPDGLIPSNETRVLFNWELPVGDRLNPNPRSCGGPRLLSFPTSLSVIRQWAPGFAALATNHILDAGEEGLANTITSLHREGFITVGAGVTQEEIARPVFWETSEGMLGIINWVFPEAHPDWMLVPGPNCWPGLEDARKAIQDLKQQVDWVLVFAHWSDELFPYPRPEDRILAGELVDAGADILVSHHPHVVRGMEMIRTCPVFYSLGNFFFSDFADDSGRWVTKGAPMNREALGIHISFKHGLKPEYKPLSFWQIDGSVIVDRRRRATWRMSYNSRPLNRFSGKKYEEWYLSKRKLFDKVWLRWHFGIRRLGFSGLIRYIINKLSIHKLQAKSLDNRF